MLHSEKDFKTNPRVYPQEASIGAALGWGAACPSVGSHGMHDFACEGQATPNQDRSAHGES